MKILFVRSNKIGSKLIRFITGEEISHVALEVNDQFVIHSKFAGVDIDLMSTFNHNYNTIYKLEPTKDFDEASVVQKIYKGYEECSYDYKGILYSAIYLLLSKIGIKLSGGNRWAKGPNYMCTELVGELVLNNKESLLTPKQLYFKLLETGTWVPTIGDK